jgi:hypothetical protein
LHENEIKHYLHPHPSANKYEIASEPKSAIETQEQDCAVLDYYATKILREKDFWSKEMLMASMSDIETTKRGSMWELDQNLDQPKDKDVSQLKDMYR